MTKSYTTITIILLLMFVLFMGVWLWPRATSTPTPLISNTGLLDKVFGPDYTEENAQLLAVITHLHNITNEAVGWNRTPNRAHARKAEGHLGELRNLIMVCEWPSLKYDLLLVDEHIRGIGPQHRDHWITAHRILHDIDFQLLGRRDNDSGEFFGYSTAVNEWRTQVR